MFPRTVSEPKKLDELLDRIRKEQTNYSASQKLVAEYIIDNVYQIPFLTITTLARNIGVSNSTVINFCSRLGYTKFAEFKRDFSECAHSELVMSNKLQDNPVEQVDDEFMCKGMNEDIAAIEATMTNTSNRDALQQLLPEINKAKHIYIVGGRSSAAFASLFACMLRFLDLKVYEIDLGASDYPDRIAMIEKGDLVIAISMPRYTAQVITAIKKMHDSGVPIALITDNGLAPACPYADIIFRCSVNSSYYFQCNAGCLSLVSVICRAVGATRKESASAHIRQLEQTLLDESIFCKN